jgi:putative PEP-CTERM system histidine kinase
MLLESLCFAAAIFSLVVAVFSMVRKRRSLTIWCFFAGMVILAADSLVAGVMFPGLEWDEVLRGARFAFIAKSFVPAAWLGFSLVYSRGDFRDSVVRWRIPLTIAAVLPIGLSVFFGQQMLLYFAEPGLRPYLRLGALGKLWNVSLLVSTAWILTNLEHTFRAAVGSTRWRIKFVVVGLAVIFGGRIYVQSEALLFSAYDIAWSGIESSALLIGCVFLVVAYIRTRFAEIQVYPSRAVLRSSLAALVVAGYLITVGILANIVKRFGGVETLQVQAFLVLLGAAGLAMVLLSDRLQQRVQLFVNRHFVKAQHDSVRIWTEFSRRLTDVKDPPSLCAVSARLISETFRVLSVTLWLRGEQEDQLISMFSTAPGGGGTVAGNPRRVAPSAVMAGLRPRSSPFDLDAINEGWAEEFKRLNSAVFPNGGSRWCVPLRVRDQSLGALVLADRVSGAPYTYEEMQLLECIADHVTSVLLNLRLANEVARARELEAFRAMSAFFVHDLKNTAALLKLMLNNMPAHFNDPAFREDMLRGFRHMAHRIDETISRLTELRQRPELKLVEMDLNELVNEALESLEGTPDVELTKVFQPVPEVLADRQQMRSVITNLALNARDAVRPSGRIQVRTEHLGDSIILCVADNGCGMSPAFVRDCLFRPFHTTKKKGLGIGMFQSRMIIEAHGGSIQVETEEGKGTTFRVVLPASSPW